MGSLTWEKMFLGFFVLFLFLTGPFCAGLTDSRDVVAMNSLYVSLGYPPLRGWILVGGDPCGEVWQGVECVYSNITGLNLNGTNLGGELGTTWDFPSILSIDLSNNQIGGSLPSNLPPTLTELSLSNNLLSGGIPDTFQPLASLIDLDLSGNNLTGPLPLSFGNLSALTILRLQNNKLTGMLDVIQDLPLADLNIENNLFSGPIPPKLLTIPNFKKDGNPFNTSVIPSPNAAPPPIAGGPTSSIAAPPSLDIAPSKQVNGQSTEAPDTTSSGHSLVSKKVLVIAGLIGVLILLVIVGLCLCARRCTTGKKVVKHSKRHEVGIHENQRGSSNYPVEKAGSKVMAGEMPGQNGAYLRKLGSHPQKDEHRVDIERRNLSSLPLQPSPPSLPIEKVIVKPATSGASTAKRPTERQKTTTSAASYNIASLQQFTNSFSQENFIGEGMLGCVYKGQLPNGKLLAIKKLETTSSRQHGDDEFIELVSSISKLRHQNIVELVGYSSEYGQRLLVYNFCKYGTLHDALHVDDEMHKKLSWDTRIRVALGAAKALEYLHEICQPAIVHRNFKSGNVLLDDDLNVKVSDCGLAPLLSSYSASQSSDIFLAAKGYAGPELELGSYTWQSDVYSFGVVMLELLTGRMPYERARPRGAQFLARWATSQLHDIEALSKMVDPSLNGAYPAKSLSRFADIISRCVQREPEFRPLMSEVVQDLLHMV